VTADKVVNAKVQRDRQLVRVQVNASYQPTNVVVDAIWRLEQQLRYLLHLHREGQHAFAQKADPLPAPFGRATGGAQKLLCQ